MFQVAVFCGGQSHEHAVSVISGKNVAQGLVDAGCEVQLIYVTKAKGEWRYIHDVKAALQVADLATISNYDPVTPLMGKSALLGIESRRVYPLPLVFPVLHGEHGEDGDFQGVLEMLNVPYVGTEVLASAVCMDKIASKQVLLAGGLKVVPYIAADRLNQPTYDDVVQKLGTPLFVKPANTGSSIGIAKVHDAAEYQVALVEALRLDRRAVIEKAIDGRELECAVLGNAEPIATQAGEIVSYGAFYDYEAKYQDNAELIVPVALESALEARIKAAARLAFQALDCRGLARVDFLLSHAGELYVNELNTMPGFTSISLYPKLWAAAGLALPQLLQRLCELALER